MSIENLEIEFECDKCGHSWMQNLLEMFYNILIDKELKELKELL